ALRLPDALPIWAARLPARVPRSARCPFPGRTARGPRVRPRAWDSPNVQRPRSAGTAARSRHSRRFAGAREARTAGELTGARSDRLGREADLLELLGPARVLDDTVRNAHDLQVQRAIGVFRSGEEP